jgi:hypothetical protein
LPFFDAAADAARCHYFATFSWRRRSASAMPCWRLLAPLMLALMSSAPPCLLPPERQLMMPLALLLRLFFFFFFYERDAAGSNHMLILLMLSAGADIFYGCLFDAIILPSRHPERAIP